MKRFYISLVIVLLIMVLYPSILCTKAEYSEEDGGVKTSNKISPIYGNAIYSFNNPYIENPFNQFQLSFNVNNSDSPFRFYFKDLKLNVLLISDTYKLQPIDIKNTTKLKKRWARAILEGLGHFIYATASYWIRQDVMKEDWEYQFTWEDQKRRFLFLDGPRFDSNSFEFNWTHSMAGAIYYNYARVNRLNILESFLFTFGASYFWEFVVEYKEVVSINDVISTPMGGLSIGESLFHLSCVFRDYKPTMLNKIASFLSNPIMSLNYWLDRKKKNLKLHEGAANLWHDIRFFIGPRNNRFSSEDSTILLNLGVETQVMTVPEYGVTGFYSGKVGSTLFTEFNLDANLDKQGVYEYNIFAKSVLFGYFNQYIRQTDSGEKTGHSFFLGVGTAFDLHRKRTPSPSDGFESHIKTDKFCIVNLLGPAIDFSLFHKRLKIRLAADAYADFALVHSLTYQQYANTHNVTNTKSTLKNHGYYYALGLTTSSALQVIYANLELKGKVKYHYFESIEGLDRFQKDMEDEDDFDLKDKRFNYCFSVSYTIPKTPFQIVLALEKTNRQGWLEDFYQQHTEAKSYFQVKYLF